MTFWLEEDIRKRVRSYETYYNYSGIVRNHINPAIGAKKMSSVTTGDVQRLYKEITSFSVSKLMGHAKEIITIDVYGDNKEIISDGVPEIEAFMENVLPDKSEHIVNDQSDIMPDVTDYYAT